MYRNQLQSSTVKCIYILFTSWIFKLTRTVAPCSGPGDIRTLISESCIQFDPGFAESNNQKIDQRKNVSKCPNGYCDYAGD